MDTSDQNMDCVCRTCLNEVDASSDGHNTRPQQQWQSVFDRIEECGALRIAELLSQAVPQMEMLLSDELPEKICCKCLHELLSAYRFQKMCVRSEEQIRLIVTTKQSDLKISLRMGTNDTDTNALETARSNNANQNIKHTSIQKPLNEITEQITDAKAVQSNYLESINRLLETCKDEDEEGRFNEFIKNESNKDGSNAIHSTNSILSVEYAEKQVNVTIDERIATETLHSIAVEHLQSIDQSLERCKDSQSKLEPSIKNEPLEDDEPVIEYSDDDTIHSIISVIKDELLPIESEEGQTNVTSSQDLHANKDTRANSATHLSLKQSIGVPNTEPFLKKHACASCGKSFKSAAALNRHLHTTAPHEPQQSIALQPYECPHCPLRFRCKQGVNQHKQIHEGVKREACDICGKKIRKGDLKRHKLTHTSEKPHKCEFCEMRFIQIQQLHDHMRTHTGEKPYKCKYCELAYIRRSALMLHLRNHLGDNVYRCDFCPLAFALASDLRSHLITHKNEDPETSERNMKALRGEEEKLRLKVCNQKTQQSSSESSQQKLEDHTKRDADKPYECPYCPLRFRRSSLMKRHKVIHEVGVKRKACDICGKSVRNLRQHKKFHSKDKPHKCDFCEKRFINIPSLRLHSRKHTGEKPFKCKYCELRLTSFTALAQHLHIHLGENVYRCGICPLAFPSASEHRLHVLSHNNEDPETRERNIKALRENEAKLRLQISKEKTQQSSTEENIQNKPYECPYCPLRFRCTQAVTRHRQIHEGIKREACNICGKTFRNLKSHKLTHGEDKPHKCDVCEKRFMRSEQLRRHKRTHTGEKPFKCKYCEHAYTTKSPLMRHLRNHLGKNVFRCDLCPSAFPIASELRSHFITHKNEDPDTRQQNMKALREEEEKLKLQFPKKKTQQSSTEES